MIIVVDGLGVVVEYRTRYGVYLVVVLAAVCKELNVVLVLTNIELTVTEYGVCYVGVSNCYGLCLVESDNAFGSRCGRGLCGVIVAVYGLGMIPLYCARSRVDFVVVLASICEELDIILVFGELKFAFSENGVCDIGVSDGYCLSFVESDNVLGCGFGCRL